MSCAFFSDIEFGKSLDSKIYLILILLSIFANLRLFLKPFIGTYIRLGKNTKYSNKFNSSSQKTNISPSESNGFT